jgi:hypothetical protein
MKNQVQSTINEPAEQLTETQSRKSKATLSCHPAAKQL